MNNTRINDIEILRAAAVLIVVLFHSLGNLFSFYSPWIGPFHTYFGGWIGVDLFLAISGFVIARSLLPQLQSCQDSHSAFRITLAFWIRRAWRLLPSAWLWLTIIFICSIIFRDNGIFASPRTTLEATVAAVLNLANLRMIDHFHTDSGANSIYWSLSLEEQFYLLLPLLIIFSRRFLIPILVLIALWQLLQERSTTMAMHMFRCDGLILGVLLAIWSRHPTYQLAKPTFLEKLPYKGTLPLLVLLVLLLLVGSHQLNIVSFKFTWVTLLSITLVWIGSYDRDVFLPKFLHPITLWIASRSYAMYLIHMPSFFLTRELWLHLEPSKSPELDLFWHYSITALLLLLILSELNYRFIEKPLRKHGAKIAENFKNNQKPI